MNKVNYQLYTDEFIAREQQKPSGSPRSRLLLHACCAPCSSYVLEYLTAYFDITVFFSNPNITDPQEYKKRLDELCRLVRQAPFCSNVAVVGDDTPSAEFFRISRGMERAPEGGERCRACFRLRLEKSARYAAQNGFDFFATTLTVSPHKNAAVINEIGLSAAQQAGTRYMPSDFKKRGGYQRSIELSRQYGLYRQNYCGCVFSRSAEEKNASPARQ